MFPPYFVCKTSIFSGKASPVVTFAAGVVVVVVVVVDELDEALSELEDSQLKRKRLVKIILLINKIAFGLIMISPFFS